MAGRRRSPGHGPRRRRSHGQRGPRVYDPRSGRLRTLASRSAEFTGLAWRPAEDDLAALRRRGDDDWADSTHVILAWRGLEEESPRPLTFDPGTMASFPDTLRVVEHRNLRWSDDGDRIFFGTQVRERAEEPDTASADTVAADSASDVDQVPPADVLVWHSTDVEILPLQEVRAERDRRDNYLAAWHVGREGWTRVGLVGHPWGGYQTAFAAPQTDLFRSAVAGAPLTNLVSMYNSIYWRTGGTDARIVEISQGRMEVPPWEDMDAYVANSPLHHVESMETPLLMAMGTDDGAVEFNQGVEFFNAARRAGKQLVFLVYDGENHGISREERNTVDYRDRVLTWFDHYLKSEPAPEWVAEGVPYLEQIEEREEVGGGR